MSRVALFGFAVGVVGGFLASLLYMWFDTEAGQAFVFSWPKAVTYTIFMGLMAAFISVLNVRRYRKKAARTASGSTGRVTTSEIR